MPARFVRKTQCIELCRGEDHKFAVENTQSKECHCLKNDPDKLLSAFSGVPDACSSKDYKVSPPYSNRCRKKQCNSNSNSNSNRCRNKD